MSRRYGYNRFTGTDITINSSMRGVVEKINFTGVSTQGANPTPDAPQTIYSSGDEGAITVRSTQGANTSDTTITLPTGYVGGSLPNGVADTDLLKKIGKVVLNGSESWGISQVLTNSAFYTMTLTGKKNVNNDVRSSHFTLNTTIYGGDVVGTMGSNFSSSLFIRSSIKVLADFKTWLSSNNVTVYYELATPTSITLTKPAISTYEGINTITTTNAVKPSLTIEAWKR